MNDRRGDNPYEDLSRRTSAGGSRNGLIIGGVAIAVVAILVVVALLAAAVYLALGLLSSGGGGGTAGRPDDYPGPGHGSVQVTVNKGDTGAAIGRTLEAAGVVGTAKAFQDAYNANPDSISIQPGAYNLLLEMRAEDAVTALLNPASKATKKVVVAEGLTVAQIAQRLVKDGGYTQAEVDAALADPAAFGLPAEAGGKPEGWLFPATYELQPGQPVADVLKGMVAKTVSVLDELGVAPDQRETVLTKASLIEREAKHNEDRPKMARTIENRLAKNWTLGIDAAVLYGAGGPGTELTKSVLQDPSNPYNLRVHKGLPPTPIASPGRPSIEAVLQPEAGAWMYWCTYDLDTGATEFAVTDAEFLACKSKLQAWMAEHDG